MFKYREYEPPKRVQIAIKNIFIIMAYSLTVTLFLAINYYYNAPYDFFGQHISDLGNVAAGANLYSMMIMIVGFGVNSLLMLVVAVIYFANINNLKGAVIKGCLSIILAIGAAGVAIPADHGLPIMRILHLVGAACFIGGFALFNAYLQLSSSYSKIIKKEVDTSPADTTWDIFLSIVVLAVLVGYFTLFALDRLNVISSSYGPIAQKATLFVDILALYFIDNKDI
jgi:hypothetical protein